MRTLSRVLMLSLVSPLALTACVSPDDEALGEDLSDDDLTAGLEDGKADGSSAPIEVSTYRIDLRDAPARTLYGLMADAGATMTRSGAHTLLRGRRTACVSDGLATFCSISARVDDDVAAGQIAGFHGKSTSTAARYLGTLLANRETPSPWFACDEEAGTYWCGVAQPRAISVDFAALPTLGDGFVYEGWAVDGAPVTTGRFVETSGVRQYVPATLAAAAFVLTIEPRQDDPAGPAATHVLAGSLAGDQALLTTEHPAALGTDFATAMARYVLATPTSASTTDNDQGIWFVDPAGSEALMLPTLPAGWTYEGWVVLDGTPISTGRFLAGMGADSDGGGLTAGPLAGPPRPGQDFIVPPRSLVGGAVVISVEPEPDDAATPFDLKPLIDSSVTALAPPATQTLANVAEARPSGVVTFE